MALDKLAVYNLTLSLLGDHRLVTITDDVEARYVLDNSWDRAVAFVFNAAYWRFAMKTTSLTHNGALTALPGYSSAFALPATFYRPHAIFTLSGSKECPLEVRQQGSNLHANTTPIYLRYVDSALIGTVSSWPETVAKALAAYLAFVTASRISQDPQAPQAMFDIWQQYFTAAQVVEAIAPDPWLDAQLNGSFLPAVRYVLAQGFWKFALKTSTINNSVGTTAPGFTYSFSKPSDLVKTQSIFVTSGDRELPVDVRENGARWSADVTSITVRYLSEDGYSASTWPDEFLSIVQAYLEARDPVTDSNGQTANPMWVPMLKTALETQAVQESGWLRHQLSGRFVNVVSTLLEDGYWRFAIKTTTLTANAGPPSDGYGYSFTRPADWWRTYQVYEDGDTEQASIDFRDEDGQFHTNYSPITVRYVSKTLGLNAANWSSKFEDAVLAKLDLREAMETPGTSGAAIAALTALANKAEKEARSKDDTREVPRVNLPSRFIAGRYGSGWGRSYREQG